ncbi:amino acid transporter [Hesseltinella vesiculosa]|uniref:Amino acid transporter n=1 Tax=Hesseltinella vesiculosa TaxID=101127 RepID=A0A1X2G8K2_9FUNG|nr:amino acid transporter [Hesseltinella vesiculosa]
MADKKIAQPKLPGQIQRLAPLAVGDQKLQRHLGYFSGTMINIGQIIGTGIFSNPALILLNTGSGGMMLILWVIGAFSALSGLLTFLELGTMLPRSTAEKEYLAYAFPKPRQLASFVFMTMIAIVSYSAGIAQGSTAFGSNIVYSIYAGEKTNDWQARGFAAFGLTFWVVVNMLSAKAAIRFNNFFTILKIALLLLLICVGFAGMSGRLPDRPDYAINFSFQGTLNNAGSYANAIYYVIYSYSGYYNLQKITDELKDPIRNLTRCGISALAFTTVLYMLANIAYLAVLPLDKIRDASITVAARLFTTAFGGVFGSQVLPVFVGLSSFGYIGASIGPVVMYSGSRVILEFAREGYMPFHRFFSHVHPKFNTPIRALMLKYSISLIFLLAPPPGSTFQFIMSFSNYGGYFFSGLCGVGLILLRRREPDLRRPIKAPLPLVLFSMAVSLYSLVFVFIPPTNKPSGYPYWVPYIVSISFGIACIGLWYLKMYTFNGLDDSYNNDIREIGQLELFKDVYGNEQLSSASLESNFESSTPIDVGKEKQQNPVQIVHVE